MFYSIIASAQILRVAAIATFCFFLSHVTHADDIDVYNTQKALPHTPYPTDLDVALPNPNYPNILFVLDASESMKFFDSGQTGSRLERLRIAMNQVLDEVEAVNIGLMRFSHRASGGRVIYPMSPIEFAREDLKEIVDNLSIDWYTPTTGALLEAALYFHGAPVHYGKTRTLRVGDRKHKREHLTRVSHPESYSGGVIDREPLCNDEDLDHLDCITENISGNPVYTSPVLSGCQKNHMILVSDGAVDNVVDGAVFEDLLGKPCSGGSNGDCASEIVEFLNTVDVSDSVFGTSTVTTHAIGFNTKSSTLTRISDAGEGSYINSASAAELASALSEIIDGTDIASATLGQPTVSVDLSNRLEFRNDMYLPVFEPALRPVWPGNLKGYWFDQILQDYSSPRKTALNPDTGTINTDVMSLWSDSADGPNASQGGAASRIRSSENRIIATNRPGGSDQLFHPDNQITRSNINAGNLGLPDTSLSLTESDTNSIIDWVRGKDIRDSNKNGDITEERKQYADPLHSNPVMVTYGVNDAAYDSVVFFGTNEGFLHAVDIVTGEDLFSFIPWDLLGNLKTSFINQPFGEKLYGMDGFISSWIEDSNNNGYVDDTSGHAYLYTGMRRGGRNYYALDVSEKTSPQLLWTIEGGKGDFTELGQSWSKMVHSKMKHPATGVATDVLVFSGGYDDSQDDSPHRSADSMGRAIYIVNAETGDLIWSAGPADATLELEDMKYSIPATPTVIDINSDGLLDQLYVGDLGGQVWRFDFPATAAPTGGVIASLSSEETGAKLFFASPDVALVSNNIADIEIVVAIGSGSRHQPISLSEDNAFYTLSQASVSEPPAGYGVKVNDSEYRPLTHADLVNITDNKIFEGTGSERADVAKALEEAHGWYLEMEALGEKVLAPAAIIDDKVVFTSYVPGEVLDCAISLGTNRMYVVDIFNGSPVVNNFESDNADGNNMLTKADRFSELATTGISAAPKVIFSGSTDSVSVLIGPELAGTIPVEFFRRQYWSEYPEF